MGVSGRVDCAKMLHSSPLKFGVRKVGKVLPSQNEPELSSLQLISDPFLLHKHRQSSHIMAAVQVAFTNVAKFQE